MIKLFSVALLSLLALGSCGPASRTTEEANSDTTTATTDYTLIQSSIFLKDKMFLGEGACFDPQTGNLLWVQIIEGRLSSYNLQDQAVRRVKLPYMVGTVVPYKRDTVAIAAEKGFELLSLDNGQTTPLARPLSVGDSLRFNDGKCDRQGRFLAGAMSKRLHDGQGTLYRLEDLDSTTAVLKGLTIPNGIVWSADGQTMYFIDTPTRQVKAYDYDTITAQISNPRVVVTIPEGEGQPDGMAIDAEGKLWVALWGGYGVGRFDPETGQMLAKVEVPAPNVTSCSFAGRQLDSLFITTARSGMKPEALSEYPKSGSIFLARPGVQGQAFTRFSGLTLLEAL